MRYMQQYQLSGLNAINDAEQIEDELQKIEGLETCYVDFVHQKLIIPQTHVSRRLLKRINDTIEKLQINITIQKEHFIFDMKKSRIVRFINNITCCFYIYIADETT